MSEVMRPMMAVFEQFCNGKSAEAKKLWYEVVTKKKIDLKTEVISFENFTDRSCVANILNESIFGNFVLVSMPRPSLFQYSSFLIYFINLLLKFL